MKKLLKRVSALLLVLLVLLISSGFTSGYTPKSYDLDRVLSTIKELTSKEFNGRATGTPDGKKTEDYFAARFKEIGLKPGGDNGTYYQSFSGTRGNPDGPYTLEVLDGSKVIKSYKYAADFKNLTSIQNSGEVTAKGVEVTSMSNIPKANGEIALLLMLNQGASTNTKPFNDLYDAGYKGIIVARGITQNRLKGQMGFFDTTNASRMPRIAVTSGVYSELVDYSKKGYNIHLATNYAVANFTANNIIGILEAAQPTQKCLVISGHMDHLAPDPDGVYFPGALDNASGSATVLEIARTLKNMDVKPNVNIVFIAFGGEEEMLYGSNNYVQKPLYPINETKDINLDMIGAKSKLPMSISVSSYSRGDKGNSEFVNEISKVAEELKANFEVIDEDASDHAPFAEFGAPAVTLIDFEKVIYHVPEDTIDNIGVDNLKRDIDITMEVIGKEAYTVSEDMAPGTSIWIYVGVGGAIIVVFAGILITSRNKKRGAAE